MEGPGSSQQSSSIESNNTFELHKKQLIFLHELRNSVYSYVLKGKDRGKECWHYMLIDYDKKEEYLASMGPKIIDANDYGKILVSGWGKDYPEDISNKTKTFIMDLKNRLIIFRLPANKGIYYFLCDTDKRIEIVESMTMEEIQRRGRILYSSLDEDPPEALWDVIEKGYFQLTRGRRFDLSNSRIEHVRSGDVQKVTVFLKEVGNVDWTDEDGWTMLHHAAHCGNLNMIRILKDMDANTQVRDKISGRKPIHVAAREGHALAVEMFLIENDSVNDMDKCCWTPLHYAAWKGESNTVKYLVSKRANTEIVDRCMGKKPIHVAAAEGHTEIVQIFLDNGANIDDTDANGRTVLYYSAYAGRLVTAKFLIDRGANVNIAKKGDVKPIHTSTHCNCLELIELLLSHGSDIESRDCNGGRPLHWAAKEGIMNVVQFIIEKGADLHAVDDEGKTPLDHAKAHLDVAAYIADKMCEEFKDHAKYSDALVIYEKLFEFQKENLGQDHPESMKTQNKIALMFHEQGKYEEALEIFNVIIRKRENTLGPCDFDTLCTKCEKARIYVAQWKLEEAMEIFKGVYKSLEDTLGANHHRTLSVSREIAFVHFRKSEYNKAFDIFEDIFEKRKLSLGIDNPYTLQAWQDMAIVLINMGENTKALRILNDVFEKRKTFLGTNHPETISAGHHIATVSRRLENEAEEKTCCIQ